MRKNDIVDYIVNNTYLRRSQAITAVDSIVEAISNSLVNGENIYIRGFATISVVTTAPKIGRNINKGVCMPIPAKKKAKIKLCEELKQKMNHEQ